MGVEEVLPGVHAVTFSVYGIPYVGAYVVADAEPTLFDTGLPMQRRLLDEAFRRAHVEVGDVRHVMLTHHHVDHTGNLAAIARDTGATVYVHALDAPYVRGETERPGPAHPSWLSSVLGRIGARKGLDRDEPWPDVREVGDGELADAAAGGVQVVHTPGHTVGHVSYILPARRLLIAGDAAGALLGRVGPPLGAYTEDMAEAKRSICKLAELDFDAACFGHGGVIKDGAHAAFRKAVEKLAR